MDYRGRQHFDHKESSKIGILVTNLGTPEAPTPKALRKYLREFLSDPRVVEINRLLWWFILKIILLIRPAKSAHAYATIWTNEGSPLALNTQAQAMALQQVLGDAYIVDWAMRYGQPSISAKIDAFLEKGVRKLLVLPLYPQYSASTTGSTFDAVAKDFQHRRWIPALRFIDGYHDHASYIDALCASIKQHWQHNGRCDKLVFTYHGVPLRYLHKGDPYHCFCHTTTRLVAQKLELKEDEFLTTFQSRFGREPWIEPYTDHTLMALAKEGVGSVQLICPGFSSDCLETLEEIAIQNKAYFLEAGGKEFQYIPALNDREEHIQCLAQIISENLQGWEKGQSVNPLTAQLAKALKYNQK